MSMNLQNWYHGGKGSRDEIEVAAGQAVRYRKTARDLEFEPME